MPTVLSKDGTRIGYDRRGNGPPVILVDGAFGSRAFGPMPRLASLLAAQFTVINYDRRGRGGSGGSVSPAPLREIEDLDALILEAGGSAFVYGFSSGAILSFRAASTLGLRIRKLALYEPPLAAPDGRSPLPATYQEHLASLVAEGRRRDAVRLFLREAVGMQEQAIDAMEAGPAWSGLEAAAPSLPFDIAIQVEAGSGRPLPPAFIEPIVRAGTETLLMRGDRSPRWLGRAAQAIADSLPGSRLITLGGQTHDVRSEILAPQLLVFFSSGSTGR